VYEVARPVSAGGEATHVQFLLVAVGEQRYAVESGHVERVAPFDPDAVTAVPNTPASVAGVASVDGEVTVLVDLRERVGAPVTGDGRLVVVEREGRAVALIVDSVVGLDTYATDAVTPASAVAAEVFDADRRWYAAVVRDGDRRAYVLDTAALVETALER
jgi:purine-binding chemotaxis protein CheW